MNNIAKRGFASMSVKRRKEIAGMGGKMAHKLGRAHKFTSEEGRIAGIRSGESRRKNNPTS